MAEISKDIAYEIIESFNNIVCEEAQIKLKKLKENLYYVAPELIEDRLFNGIRSTHGLCAILQQHESENNKCRLLYETITNKYYKVDDMTAK